MDIVFECTGALTAREDLDQHIRAGARYVILSAPSRSEDVDTIVHGVNAAGAGTSIISCASCTTNCVTPVMEILDRRIGVKKAVLTTIHAYTASQAIVDAAKAKPRMGRAGAANIVPATTGAAKATTKALPDYRGRFDGHGLSCSGHGRVARRHRCDHAANPPPSTRSTVCSWRKRRVERYRHVLGVTADPIVSSDIIKDPHARLSSISA